MSLRIGTSPISTMVRPDRPPHIFVDCIKLNSSLQALSICRTAKSFSRLKVRLCVSTEIPLRRRMKVLGFRHVRFFNRACESSSVWLAFGADGTISARVTLLSAVGLRMCGAASIGRKGLESHAFGRALTVRSGHVRLHPDLIVHAGTKLLGRRQVHVIWRPPPCPIGSPTRRATCDA